MENIVLRQKQKNIYIGIIVWFIVKVQFYQYVGFPQAALIGHLASIFAACMFLLCIRDILDVKEHKIISYITIGVFISFFITIILWDASPFLALQAHASSLGLLYVVVFFALRKISIEKKTVEKIMIALSVIYLLCWGYALFKLPELIFGIDRDGEYGEITRRGFYRLFIPGNVSSILSFLFLNSYLNKQKAVYLALAIGMFIIVILHVGRQMILWTMIISALMFYMHYRKKVIYLIIAVVVGYHGFLFLVQEIPAVSNMIEITDEQSENFEDDIRLEACKHFLFEYPHNPVTMIFGNGVPARKTELYQINHKSESCKYYQEDVGFVAMYCNYGVWGVLGFLFLLLRIIRLKVEPEYEYFKYYIFYTYGVYLMSQSLTIHIFELMMAYYVVEKSAKDLQSDR